MVLLAGAVVVWRTHAAGFLWGALAPILQAGNSSSTSETERLREALASTTARLADRDVLYQENLALKERLGANGKREVILGAVIMRPPGIPYDTLIIDTGVLQGVRAGDLVSAGGTVLIGVVLDAYTTTSRVSLLSSPGSVYSAVLHTKGGTGPSLPVSVEGQGAGSLVGQVPAGTSARVGDVLLFPGIAGGFAGVVSYVDKKEGDSFETLYMQLPVDPLSLQYVEVWKTVQ